MEQNSLQVSGSKLSQVVCENCETQYYYFLGRVGESAVEAFANFPSLSRQRVAGEVLRTRLEGEAELVPCPNCAWISQPLVKGFRRTVTYRWLRSIYLTLIVASVFLFLGLLPNGPGDPLFQLMFLIVLFFTLPVLGYFLVRILFFRMMFRPNRLHPEFPVLPPGTPAAYVEKDGKLVSASKQVADKGPAGVKTPDAIDYQVGRHSLPLKCSVCLDPTSENEFLIYPAYGNVGVAKIDLKVPLCTRCRKLRTWKMIMVSVLLSSVISAAILTAFWIFGIGFQSVVFNSLIIFVPVLMILLRLTAFYLRIVKAKLLDSSRGVLKLKFYNKQYQELVVKVNME